MDVSTAQLLVQAIAQATQTALDNQNRFNALELALKSHDPALHQKYLEMLQKVAQNPASINSVAFSNIQSRLVRG